MGGSLVNQLTRHDLMTWLIFWSSGTSRPGSATAKGEDQCVISQIYPTYKYCKWNNPSIRSPVDPNKPVTRTSKYTTKAVKDHHHRLVGDMWSSKFSSFEGYNLTRQWKIHPEWVDVFPVDKNGDFPARLLVNSGGKKLKPLGFFHQSIRPSIEKWVESFTL